MLLTMGPGRRWARPPLVTVVVLATVAVAWVGIDALATRFAALDAVTFDGRVGIWRDSWRMAQDMPLAGVGIRAYPVASLLYQSALPQFHVGAAHNDWLQLAAEGGLLVSLPACFLLVTLAHQARARFREHRRERDYGTTYWIRAGAVTGLVAIGLQSLHGVQPADARQYHDVCRAVGVRHCANAAAPGDASRPRETPKPLPFVLPR